MRRCIGRRVCSLEFGRAIVEEGRNILRLFGRAARAVQVEREGKSKVLLLGSRFVAKL